MSPPFTVAEFLDVFARYNTAVWPAQLGLVALAVAAVVLALRPRPGAGRAIALLLALLWLWMGVGYHLAFFAAINPLARVFGAAFVLQAGVLAGLGWWRPRLSFRARWDGAGIAGGALVLYALVVYPILAVLAGHGYPAMPTFGLPCPTTIFTFGLLLWTDARVPRAVLVIPFLWALIGMSAAIGLGMREDFGLVVAALVSTAVLLRRRERPVPPRA
jgi:hypothetical protein